ncbi:hypothetical protein Q4511_10585 [Paracoccus sp. 1_MG-2023]|nr:MULTISPECIES: hypothetical protein [unclassified Paracoccus (in: a-proteobacteria)]MDO6669370.1 hypothetical protein [Paracoccus sp. 1_MG-2023]
MNIPEWFKPGLYGAAIGAVCVGVIGFTWGGWITAGTSMERAMEMSRKDVVASMVPVCIEMARLDPERALKMEAIRSASTYERRNALMSTGWSTIPGTDAPNRDVAQACLANLQL